MNNPKSFAAVVLITIAAIMTSCKSTKLNDSTAQKSLPNSYFNESDTSNLSRVKWAEYFGDANLATLINEGLQNNLDLLSMMQRIKIAQAGVKYSNGLLLPTVGLAGGASLRKFGLYTMDRAGNITTDILPGKIIPDYLPDYFVGIQTAWEVDVWGKIRNKKRAAVARYLASIEGTNWTITSLIAEIASSYYELMALDNELKIITQTIKIQEDAFAIVQVQKQANVVNELAVQQFEAQLLNSRGLELDIIQLILEEENRINFLLARYPQKINRSAITMDAPLIAQYNAGIPSDLLVNRPDIRQAELDLIASKADVKSAKAAFYPSLNITGTLGFQAFNPAYLFTAPQSVALGLFGSLVAPVINRSAIKAQFNAASADQAIALNNYQKTIINGYVEVYNELARIKNLQQKQDLKRQEVAVLNRSSETSGELFSVGRANYLEILMTQKSTLLANLELINTQRGQYQSKINLYKALGGGWQ